MHLHKFLLVMLTTVVPGMWLLMVPGLKLEAQEPVPPNTSSQESLVGVTLKLDQDPAFRGDTFYAVTDLCGDRGLPADVEGPCNTLIGPACLAQSPLVDNPRVTAEVVDFQPFQRDLQFRVTVEPGKGGDSQGLIDQVRFVVRCLDLFSGSIVQVDATKVAESTHRTVFVTSETYTGDLGGIGGADEKCNALARKAGLYGTYKAWISHIYGRFDGWSYSTLPYVRVDGVKVADDYGDLIDCANPTCLQAAINVDENGHSPSLPLYAWTFKRPTGHSALVGRTGGFHQACGNWYSADPTYSTMSGQHTQYGWLGEVTRRDEDWTYNPANRQPCNLRAHLYCFQQ